MEGGIEAKRLIKNVTPQMKVGYPIYCRPPIRNAPSDFLGSADRKKRDEFRPNLFFLLIFYLPFCFV